MSAPDWQKEAAEFARQRARRRRWLDRLSFFGLLVVLSSVTWLFGWL